MKYLYCSKSLADEGCNEVEKGVFGRPVFNSDIKKLLAKGWVKNASEVRPEKAKRQEKKAEPKAEAPQDLLGEE